MLTPSAHSRAVWEDIMNKLFVAAALAAALAQPAAAVSFPQLTTIYVGSGVIDSGSAAELGIATAFHCTNVSGASANVRVLVLNLNGTVAANTTQTLAHGATRNWSTHGESTHREDFLLSTGEVEQGAVNIES